MANLIDQLKSLSIEQIAIAICFVFIIIKRITHKKRHCPHCKAVLTNQIIPKSIKTFFSGELICQNCNKEIDVDFYGNIKE